MNKVRPSSPPNVQFVKFFPPWGEVTILALGIPSASTTKTLARLGWHMNRLPSSSTVRPSGPDEPKDWKNNPAFVVLPSELRGRRHTEFDRVMATYRNRSSGDSAIPFGETPLSTKQSSLPSGQSRYTRPEGSDMPVWPWSVKYIAFVDDITKSFGPLKRSKFRRARRGEITPVDGSRTRRPCKY